MIAAAALVARLRRARASLYGGHSRPIACRSRGSGGRGRASGGQHWAWEGRPVTLETELTPVLVDILNQSSRPLRIGYEGFHFISEAKASYAALPPYRIEAEVARPVAAGRPYYPYAGFGGAPYLRVYYPRLDIYDGPFAFSDRYYGANAPIWSRHRSGELPTQDMLQRALPEESSSRVAASAASSTSSGSRPRSLHVQRRSGGCETGERFGVITIPFVAE